MKNNHVTFVTYFSIAALCVGLAFSDTCLQAAHAQNKKPVELKEPTKKPVHKPHSEASIKKANELLHKFRDDANFKWPKFVDELTKTLADQPKYAEFCKALKQTRNAKSPKTVGEALAKYKSILPKESQELIDKMGTGPLALLLMKRLSQ